MDVEHLSCVVDDLPPAKLILLAKMEKALSLLKDSLGSTASFFAQFWAPDNRGAGLENQPYPHLCVPNSTLLEYRQLDERYKFWERFSGQDILGRTWIYGYKFPEWTSNVSYYRPDEYAHLSDAISCGVRGIIAFPVFESDQTDYCCAVLELVTMEEKQDFDLEREKVVEALQAANLQTKLPRRRPWCFNEVQTAALTEIADVTRAVCQTHRLPLALTWIPWGRHDDILKLGDLGHASSWGLGELEIERTACYADEEMQGFVHACEQLFLSPWKGAAGQAFRTCLPSFEPDVKEKHVNVYPFAHHARKYNLNAAVAILLRSTVDDCIYILEFFLPILVKESSEQQDLVEKLKLTIKQTCKSLTMFSEKPFPRKRGLKVSKNNDKIEPAPDPDGHMFIERADNKRRKVSEVWKHFDKVIEENGAVRAICKGCLKKYPGESTKGTSNLHKHLKSCSKKRQRDAKQHTLPSCLGGNFVFDQERSRLNFVRMIMKLGFPLDMVQNEFFKTFVYDLQPQFQLCSQDTVQADALSIYRQEKEKLVKYLDNLSSLFSITIDLQSYGDNKMTCCLTMHFIDDGWRMNKKILAFRSIEHDYMNEAVKDVLVEWNIKKKVRFMFAEIAPPNSQMTREVRRKHLSQFPYMNGDLLCLSCYAQTLELLARDGFYEIKDVLNKIRGCIEYVNATPTNQDKFREATNNVKLQDMKAASHDDPARWKTTFVMLRSALELREAFTQLEQVDFDLKVNPSAEEWKMAMIVCECLKVIHKSLGSSSSSIDACFLHVCYIYKNLLSWEKSEHAYVCSMAKRMKVNLDRHWSEWSFAFGILLVLDPCRKLEFVQYGFELMYGSVANDMYVANLQAFRSKLTCMYNSYANGTGYLASPARDISCFASYDLDSDIGNFRGFCEWHKQKHDGDVVDPSKSDLDRYLGEPLENRDKVSDVLAWWRVNAPRFPALGKMARDFLAIPISAILSKSTISGEATKVNPSFNGLGPDIIEAFICGQDWLKSPENNSKEGKPGSSLVSTDVRFDSPGKQMSKYLAGPFTVSKHTSPEDLKLIQYVFDSSLSESETIVQCKNYHLSRRELYSLRPETWLDDIVLSTVSDAMTSVQRKMEGSANADDPSKCISFAKTHMIKENYMSNLLCCEKAFVPVFDNERRHFFLFVLQLKRQVVEIWDSLAASQQSAWVDKRLHNLLVSLDGLFKDDIDQNYQKVWSFKDFRVERPSNVPQQQNGHDCGVYVIKFMLAPEELTNPDFMFDSENERLEVVLRLLASDVNSCRNDLASKAEAYYEQRNSTSRKLTRECGLHDSMLIKSAAANLHTNLLVPRPRPQCLNEVQRAALTEIADVTIAVNLQ
ncbi:hypothetical protein NC651_036302 [Populus alba x Populus x berolinensis]|nr:hypothetical protein NC651_036302 [Populus alba x Populus x berolinensis]